MLVLPDCKISDQHGNPPVGQRADDGLPALRPAEIDVLPSRLQADASAIGIAVVGLAPRRVEQFSAADPSCEHAGHEQAQVLRRQPNEKPDLLRIEPLVNWLLGDLPFGQLGARISEAILSAMETAASAGAVVYFEPSAIESDDLFDRALRLVSVIKFSSDRLSHEISKRTLHQSAISIVTHGSAGLEIRKASTSIWCKAAEAPHVRDTCGSGDMVSIGLIDWMLSKRHNVDSEWSLDALVPGIVAGQKLAAFNCAYAGARGIFQQRGAAYVREILDKSADQFDLFGD